MNTTVLFTMMDSTAPIPVCSVIRGLNFQSHIPGNLQQPDLVLPFAVGKRWTYTGGPHAAWGSGEPLAAIDFAPGVLTSGCVKSREFVVAMADGQIVRSESALAILDLDKDGDERTGWVIFYLHLGKPQINPGVLVKTGDPIGHPSCEGGFCHRNPCAYRA